MNRSIAHTLRAAADLIRLTKQYGTVLLLMPALWALMIASEGKPSLALLLIFTCGSFLMRSAGCIMNDIADRDLDPFVERTKGRPLASGELSVREAMAVFFLLLILAALLLLLLDPLTMMLAPVALALAVIYPYTKRFFPLPQVVLGCAFGWGALMAWASVRGKLELPAVLIFAANIFWTTAYDTIYALMDVEDDRRIGVKSSAILFGRSTWIAVGLSFLGCIVCLFLVGSLTGLGEGYNLTVALIALCFLYQTVKIRGAPSAPLAFSLFKSHAVLGIVLAAGIGLDYICRHLSCVL